MHLTRFTVRATQVDTLGHLNNAAYLELFEWARWEWSADSGLDLAEIVATDRVGPAIVHIDLSFRREVKMHEVIQVRTWFHKKLSDMRAVIRQEMYRSDGELAAALVLTMVFISLETRHAIPIPQRFIDHWGATAPEATLASQN